jgi:hypothetical protein
MERVALESLRAMAGCRDALALASDRRRQGETTKLAAMKTLLSPFPRGTHTLLDILSPEEAFPFLHSGGIPAGSWITTLLHATSHPPVKRNPESILADALRLSAIALAAEAFVRERTGYATGKPRPVHGEKGHSKKPAASLPGGPAPWEGGFACSTPEEIDAALPDSPSPVLLLVSDEDRLRDDGRETQESRESQEKLLNRIEGACRKAAWVCRLPNVALLSPFARRVYAKWGLPVSMTGGIAVVFSSSLIRGLGALALGFTLASFPGYPIQGSPLVERYMTRDLKSRFGHGYLALPPQEDPCEAILGSLAP